MKYTILFLATAVLFLQCSTQKSSDKPVGQINLSELWAEIDSLEKKGLFKSANEKLDAINIETAAANDKSNQIKATIYRAKYAAKLSEDTHKEAITIIEEKLADEESAIHQSIYESLLGGLYYSYATKHQFKITKRTAGQDNSTDIDNWSLGKIINVSNDYYLSSTASSASKGIALHGLGGLIHDDKTDTEGFDLYALLLKRAADHFSNNRSLLTDPVNAFSLYDEMAFSDVDAFIKHKFKASDDRSYSYNALGLYQKLLTHLKGDWQSKVDLDRLQYVHRIFRGANKESLYIGALQRTSTDPNVSELNNIAKIKLAQLYRNKGSKYSQNFNKEFKPYLSKAHDLVEEVLSLTKNEATINSARKLKQEIESVQLNVSVEQVNIPNRPFLYHIEYRNVDRVDLRLIHATEDLKNNILYAKDNEEINRILTGEKAFREWSEELLSDDFNVHATELKMQALNLGEYYLHVRSGEITSFQIIRISNLSYFVENAEDNLLYTVTDRIEGKVIPNVKLNFYKQDYKNRKRNRAIKKLVANGQTDNNGEYKRKVNNRDSESVVLQSGADILDLNAYQNYYERHQRQERDVLHVFTDRNLYRPGQKVYLKAIVLKSDKNANPLRVLNNTRVEIVCRNANGKEVYKSNVETNDYGSIVEEFLLPTTGLPGQYSIEVSTNSGNAYQTIQVEEYKRPKFYVELEKPEVEYAIGDDVSIKGRVKMFAGSPVDEAKLNYRITRSVNYPYYRYYSRRYPSKEKAEIKNGYLIADSNGEFKIDFTLDEEPDSGKHAIHNYTISVDATDVSGETQSTSDVIGASIKSVFISLSSTGNIEKRKLDSLTLFSKNINGNEVPFSGRIVIEKLTEPASFKRNKYWLRLDTMLLSQQEYSDLPHDYMFNKSSYQNWEIASVMYNETFNSEGAYLLSLPNTIDAGVYRLKVLKNDEEELVDYLSVINQTQNRFNKSELLYHTINKDKYEPGETVELVIGSTITGLNVLSQIEKDEKLNGRKWLKLNGKTSLKIPVEESDRGGFVIHLNTVYQNRVYQKTITIDVPWTNKILDINTTTFRSTLQPGSEEKWTIEITDANNNLTRAELVAAMYDASLDALYTEHHWQAFNYHTYYPRIYNRTFGYQLQRLRHLKYPRRQNIGRGVKSFKYPKLDLFGLMSTLSQRHLEYETMDQSVRGRSMKSMSVPEMAGAAMVEEDVSTYNEETLEETTTTNKPSSIDWSQIRQNLEETVFFYPELLAKQDGKVTLDFTMSEALTKWKLLLFAHDKQARYAEELFELETKKDVMLFPNVPRFVRVGDKIKLSGKATNMSAADLTGTVMIRLEHPITAEDVTEELLQSPASYTLNIASGKSEAIEWELDIDEKYMDGIVYKMIIQSNAHSDGEEGFIPVLTNKLLVTESLPFYTKGQTERTYNFDRLNTALNKNSAKPHQYSIEYVSNPSWYAIQALPYLTEKRYESSEQIFNRFFANTIGEHIANSDPLIQKTLKHWQQTNSAELESNLQKNQDLKMATIEDTPWLRQAENEAEQKRAVISFFDENNLTSHIRSSVEKLAHLQNSDGGFSWCPGARSSLFISAQILEGLGKLNHLGIKHTFPQKNIHSLVNYIDDGIKEQLNKKDRHYGVSQLYLLYSRSFYLQSKPLKISVDKILEHVLKDWAKKDVHDLSLLSIVVHRYGNDVEANEILASIKEQMIRSEELGSYWKKGSSQYANHSAVDKQVRMIELFEEMQVDQDLIDELRIWLLRNKQTNHWKSTRSTSAAVYALLLQSGDRSASEWLSNSEVVEVTAAGETLFDSRKEKGTLYARQNWTGSDIKSELADITIDNPNDQVSWGAVYLQYFDDMDKVTGHDISGLSISKEIFRKINSDTGPKLEQIQGGALLSPGDKLVVKVICKADRALEYVHLKDMRAAGTEPVDVISQRKWQDGLSYYQTTQDLSTNFFIDHMQKGTYVLEYELRVNLTGTYSTGMATLQCAYAPEFVAHSNAVNLRVE